MCGICGWVVRGGGETWDESLLRKMTGRMSHRGPDDEQIAFPPSRDGALKTALGHRRLAIIDLEGGVQPMADESGRVQLTYNGEIYNFPALKEELESLGHRFGTRSDVEVLLRSYLQWDLDCVDRLRGMFAFGIWDGRTDRLFLARDRFGKKPLYYTQTAGGLAFASKIESLHALPGVPREPDFRALGQYLVYQYVPAPLTAFAGIRKLEPAHRLVWEKGDLRTERYWNPEPMTGLPSDETEIRRMLRERIEASVRMRMIADVPIGAFLSGGIDSSITAAVMASQSSAPIRTFSIGFEETGFNELPYARAVADRIGSEHEEQVVRPSALEILPKLIRQYNEPFGDSSAIPTMYLSEMTSRRVKTALSGDGGDELFLGYRRYGAVRLASFLDRMPGVRPAARMFLWKWLFMSGEPGSKRKQAARFLQHLSRSPLDRYLHWVCIFAPSEMEALVLPEHRNAWDRGAAQGYLEQFGWPPSGNPGAQAARIDLESYLPNDLLTKVDAASMAYSLEVRCPFLDSEVAALALAIPPDLRRGKRILKETFREDLPPEVMSRPKQGFGVPIGAWLRGELRPLLEDLLSRESVRRRGWLDPDGVDRYVREHLDRRGEHGAKLWSLVVLESWARMFLDEPSGK